MKLKAFVITNVPQDEELILNFVEGTIDEVCVKSVQYSSISNGTVLVSLEEHTDFEDVTRILKENEELLGVPDKGIEVLDPVSCDDKVVVENLDENVLSLNLLKLYIESTFADGYDIVSECKRIPECNITVVTFTDLKVVDLVLESEDHTPLPSIDYHIKMRPFYKNFDFSMVEDLIHQRRSSRSSEEVYSFDPSKDNSEFLDSNQVNASSSNFVRLSNGSERKQSPTNSDCTKDSENVEEEETLNMSKIRWNLLKDKLKQLPCELKYEKEDEVLKIYSEDVSDSKSIIIDLARSVNKSTLRLSETQRKFLNRDKIKTSVITFLSENLTQTTIEFDEDSLTVHSLGNSEEHLSKVRDRFLHTTSIQLPEDTPKSKIRECYNHCSNYLVILSSDDDATKLTLTGMVEDVTLASDDIKQMLEECRCFKNTFRLTGNEALYVNKYEMTTLENLFQNAVITDREIQSEKIYFEYSCQRIEMKQIEEKLNIFTKSIKKNEVDMKEYSKEELALVRNYLKMDTDTLDDFQMVNRCCIIAEGYESSDFLGTSKSKAEKGRKNEKVPSPKKSKSRLSYGSKKKQKKEIKITSSCKLQIKPFGNIAREKTDLLVCGVDESLDLNKTMVSKVFLKMDSSLQGQMSMYSFSTNRVHVEQRQLPNTKCKAIAFVIMSAWQQGASDQNLNSAIIEVLDTANRMGLSSLSFPPLGCGRAFKFPVSAVAQTFINAIDSFMKSNSGNVHIKLINLLAPDRYLFSEMSKVVDSVFPNDKNNKSSSHDDSSDDAIDDDDDDNEKEEGAKAMHSSSGEDDEEELQMEAVEADQPLMISIVHTRDENMSTKFKLMVKKQWLYVDHFKTDKIAFWPSQLLNEVIKAAKLLGVWVNKEDSVSKGVSCKIKGKKQAVLQMKTEIYENLFKSNVGQGNNLLSPSAPKRGTKEFIKYAAKCDDKFPPYWKLKDRKRGSENFLVSVDDKTSKAIEKVFKATWDQSKVGSGNDAANMPSNSGIKVIEIKRLENPQLFVKYSMRRKCIFSEMDERKEICRDVSKLRKSKGSADTMKHLPDHMKKDLYDEINEVYLFHGTKHSIIKSISKQGMDIRLSNQNAMFGQGVYLAESSTKSDQYSDPPDGRVPNGNNLTMILTRVTLGDVFLCDDKHESLASKASQKLRRPPCTSCFKDRCTCASKLFHSVMGDGKWIFREFVVYENSQCYPEYFITYQRI